MAIASRGFSRMNENADGAHKKSNTPIIAPVNNTPIT